MFPDFKHAYVIAILVLAFCRLDAQSTSSSNFSPVQPIQPTQETYGAFERLMGGSTIKVPVYWDSEGWISVRMPFTAILANVDFPMTSVAGSVKKAIEDPIVDRTQPILILLNGSVDDSIVKDFLNAVRGERLSAIAEHRVYTITGNLDDLRSVLKKKIAFSKASMSTELFSKGNGYKIVVTIPRQSWFSKDCECHLTIDIGLQSTLLRDELERIVQESCSRIRNLLKTPRDSDLQQLEILYEIRQEANYCALDSGIAVDSTNVALIVNRSYVYIF